jgi:hypothetical protein
VKHHTASRFWKLHYALPDRVQKAANKAYDLLKENPTHRAFISRRSGSFGQCDSVRAIALLALRPMMATSSGSGLATATNTIAL